MLSYRFARALVVLSCVLALAVPTALVRSADDDDSEKGGFRGAAAVVEEATNTDPPFYVRVHVDHEDGVYKVGEEMKVSVISEKEGYLYLFYIAADGKVACLFPNKAQSDNHIEGKTEVTVPKPGERFKIRITKPTGKEILKAVVTLEPLKSLTLDELTKGNVTSLTLEQFKGAMAEPTGGTEGKPRQKAKQRWAEHDVHTQVVDADGGGQTGRSKSKRVGVFVGISQFQSPQIRKLRASHNDAIKLAEAMKRCGALTEDPVVLTNDKATLKNIEKAIKDMAAQTRPGDMAVIFWSGHGGRCAATGRGDREPDGYDEFLVPYDAKLDDIETMRSTMLMDDTFGRWIQALDGRKVLVILDACHSGGQAATTTKDIQDCSKGIEIPGIKDGKGKFKEFFCATEFNRLTKDIGQKEAAVVASSRANQVSFERREGDLSVMTYYLVEQLNKSEGGVTLPDFADNLKEKVPAYVSAQFPGATQTPVFVDQTTPTVYVKPRP